MDAYKLYIPAGSWLVETLTTFCLEKQIGNAEVTAIGSLTNIWVLVNPNGKFNIQNWNGMTSYEMTSLVGNIALRQGMPRFDKSGLSTGAYPQFDLSVMTFNPYAHVHVTFANPDMTISGGHLLDSQVSIGVEAVVRSTASTDCVPGQIGPFPPDCTYCIPVTVMPYGTFFVWDKRSWYPPSA